VFIEEVRSDGPGRGELGIEERETRGGLTYVAAVTNGSTTL